MIMQNLALLLAIAVPIALLIVLRTNAAIVFLSLCAGALLVRFVGDDAGLVGSAIGNNSVVVSQYAQVALLLIPVVLSAILLGKSMRGPKGLLNILPAIGVGLVGVLLVVPLLPTNLNEAITASDGWSIMQDNQQLIIVISVVVSLVALWLSHPKTGGKKKHH